MKKLNFTEDEIIDALLRIDNGQISLPELCRDLNISLSTYYKWRNKFNSLEITLRNRIKELEAQVALLKRRYAEERLKADILQQAILERNEERKLWRKKA